VIVVVVVVVVAAAVVVVVRTACTWRHNYEVSSAPPSRLSLNMLSGAYTYSNSDQSCVSWINHILCTKLLDSIIYELKVLYDYTTLSIKLPNVTDKCLSSDITSCTAVTIVLFRRLYQTLGLYVI